MPRPLQKEKSLSSHIPAISVALHSITEMGFYSFYILIIHGIPLIKDYLEPEGLPASGYNRRLTSSMSPLVFLAHSKSCHGPFPGCQQAELAHMQSIKYG